MNQSKKSEEHTKNKGLVIHWYFHGTELILHNVSSCVQVLIYGICNEPECGTAVCNYPQCIPGTGVWLCSSALQTRKEALGSRLHKVFSTAHRVRESSCHRPRNIVDLPKKGVLLTLSIVWVAHHWSCILCRNNQLHIKGNASLTASNKSIQIDETHSSTEYLRCSVCKKL